MEICGRGCFDSTGGGPCDQANGQGMASTQKGISNSLSVTICHSQYAHAWRGPPQYSATSVTTTITRVDCHKTAPIRPAQTAETWLRPSRIAGMTGFRLAFLG